MKLSISFLDVTVNIKNIKELTKCKFGLYFLNIYSKDELREFSVLRVEKLNIGWDVEICGLTFIRAF